MNSKLILAVILLNTLGYFSCWRNTDADQLIFKDPYKSVQKSMLRLRQLCEAVEPEKFMNCFVVEQYNTLIFKEENLGNMDTISINNKGFSEMKPEDVESLLSTLKFLNRNDIPGLYHDTSTGFWLYSYKRDAQHSGRHSIRDIYIWDVPKDTLQAKFNYYYKSFDRKNRMMLIGLNEIQVPYELLRKK